MTPGLLNTADLMEWSGISQRAALIRWLEKQPAIPYRLTREGEVLTTIAEVTAALLQRCDQADDKPERINGLAWAAEHARELVFPPEHIVASASEFRYADNPGPSEESIYFLLDGDEIAYVGKAHRTAQRLRAHFNAGAKRFDRFWCITGIPREALPHIEGLYIHWLRPRDNVQYRGCDESISDLVRELEAGHVPWSE